MSFADHLTDYTAAQIIAALGCERATAYDWKSGRRSPPVWQQAHWLRILAAYAKRHNKTLMPTDTSRLAVSRKRKQ